MDLDSNSKNENHSVRVVLVGDADVGKSAIIKRYRQNTPPSPSQLGLKGHVRGGNTTVGLAPSSSSNPHEQPKRRYDQRGPTAGANFLVYGNEALQTVTLSLFATIAQEWRPFIMSFTRYETNFSFQSEKLIDLLVAPNDTTLCS
ncbi:15290_t:CDS:2 [Acaulospora colombiana]|uniref:15290_t:CDS:1 n=1 Tax=Acaulospora colombiana TaxID=27376 RepID=A0ACA9P9W0_9GLOM|nr:15290_t:CDS:2 [Acaulospora colombiana]